MSILLEQYLALKEGESKKSVPPPCVTAEDTQAILPETLQTIFQKYLDDLNRRCVQGLLGKVNPSLLAHVQEAQARVDTTWADCLAGRASQETFRQAVGQWHGAVIALFTSPQAQVPLSQERL